MFKKSSRTKNIRRKIEVTDEEPTEGTAFSSFFFFLVIMRLITYFRGHYKKNFNIGRKEEEGYENISIKFW